MSERSEVKRDNAKAQKNSGRGQWQKADAKWRGFLVDYKEYPKGIRITPEIWEKICSDTMRSARDHNPLLKIIMGEDNGKVRLGVIEWEVLEQLINGTYYE